MAFVFRSIRLERIEHERRRTCHALRARIPRACRQLLPARDQQPGAGTARRRQLDRVPRAQRSWKHHPWCFALLPDPYTGAKELSYPACRRLGPDEPARPISACRAWHSWAACGLVTTSSRPSDGSAFADRPQDSNAGGAAIFRDVASGRYFMLWPRRLRSTRYGGSRRLTPASGAWLFQYLLLGSGSSSPREIARYFSVSPKGCTPWRRRCRTSGKRANLRRPRSRGHSAD